MATHSVYISSDMYYNSDIQELNRHLAFDIKGTNADIEDEYKIFRCEYSGTLLDGYGHTYEQFLMTVEAGTVFGGSNGTEQITFIRPANPPSEQVVNDAAAWNLYTSYMPYPYGTIETGGSISQFTGLLINDVEIWWYNALSQEWELKGKAYRDGKFYDEALDLDNPYTDSEPEDSEGDGPADWSRDTTPERPLPSSFFSNSGLVGVYTPTPQQLKDLSDYLWSDNGLDLDQFKKIVNDPFDIIMGLNYIPFEVTIAGSKPLNVGNILGVDTGLSMNYPTQENYYFDFGGINIKEEMKAFCDYSPHSKISLHLPFIGTQALDIDILRNGKYNPYNFNLKYKYNIVTGTLVAYLISSDGVIVYSWASNVSTPIPVASNDYTNMLSGLVSLATNAVSGAVTGGMLGGAGGAVVGGLIGGATGGANTMASLKPTVCTNGGIGSCAAVLSPTNYAYFILEQPQMQLDEKYKKYNGLPRNISMKISNAKARGYNEIEGIRLEVNRATQSEKQEIEQILKTGYIYGSDDGSVIDRPTLPSQDDAQIALYQTDSSNIRIDKHCKHLHTYSNIIIKDATSITSPTIRLKASDTNVCIANYAYIPKFHRYYYIEDVISVSRDIWDIVLKCDVLMSHKTDIIDQMAVFKRSQKGFNLYLNDDRIQIDARPHVYTRRFPNALTDNGTYVLLVAGGN